MRKLLLILLVLLCSSQLLVFGQEFSNNEFKVGLSQFGVASLKHTRDVYDTDYILAGRSLGDVFLRYRSPGQDWKEAVSAGSPQNASSTNVSYSIGRIVPTVATSSRTMSSIGPWGTRALNDQIEPKNSHDTDIPFFAWGDHHGTKEWVEYDFDHPREVSFAEVYWAIGSYDDYKWDLPVSWSLQYKDGAEWKDVGTSGNYGIAADKFNRVDFEPVTTQALRLVAQLPPNATSAIYEWRVNTDQGKQVEPINDIASTSSFRLDGDSLVWTIDIRNPTEKQIEIGDLGIVLPFNTDYVPDKTETYTKRLIRHSFIGGDGSYIFWIRCNAIGPYLVMVPEKGTHFEYFDQEEERSFTAYIHSSARRADLATKGGTWRLPSTNVVLAPKGQAGDSVKYGFRFRWAKDYAAVREVLYQQGGFDVNVVPGMTVPTDLPTMFSLRTQNKIRDITPEHPSQTTVKLIRTDKDTSIYSANFSRLGENMLKVQYGNGQYLALDFFVTEPLETLIKKRAHFLMMHEQWNDPKRWYNGLYSQWDMKHQILRSPDDLDGLQSYSVACDDPALGKAPYLAAKNVSFPDQDEITSVENYIQHYVWVGCNRPKKSLIRMAFTAYRTGK